ncbi:MAG: YitT family protein [Firmicutes bacterium]|nr:YitT family protein [Bacillota bacterium]
MKAKNHDSIKSYIITFIGVLLVSAGMFFFLMPNDLAVGGANGIGIVLSQLTGFEVGDIMIAVNILLFILAFILIGGNFGAKTIVASLGTSLAVSILERVFPAQQSLSGDLMLDLFCGVIISGVGIGMVFNQGASTGGTDIVGKIINKFTGINLGSSVLFADLAITIIASFVFGSKIGLYSLFGVILNGLIIDFTIDGMNIAKEVTIVTKDVDSLVKFIHNDIVRSCTLYYAEGGYSKEKIKVLVTVLDRRGFVMLKNYIKENDPNAFIWVKNASEVLGLGFKNIIE